MALLAVVATSAPRAVGRDEITVLLWPGSDSERASQSLDQTLSWIRHDLGDDLLVSEPDGRIGLDPSKLTVDLWRFRDALAGNDPADAVEAYDGPFLDGFEIPGLTEFNAWVAATREELEGRHAEALEARATQAETRPAVSGAAAATEASAQDGPGRVPRWAWPAAAVLLVVSGAFLGRWLVAGGEDHATIPPADRTVVVLGSGITSSEGRDTTNRIVACEGPACPPGNLPQAAFLVPKHPAYAAPVAGTRFIATVPDGTTVPSPGYPCCTTATFESDFTLPPDAVSATITITMLADNQAKAAINGDEFARQPHSDGAENFSGPAKVFSKIFAPDPSGTNRLRLTLWNAGGSVALEYHAVVTHEVVHDADGDGVPDDEDAFPHSDLRSTVMIGTCDAAVANQPVPGSNGATFNDLVKDARTSSGSPDELLQALSSLAEKWQMAGLISGADRERIVACASGPGKAR